MKWWQRYVWSKNNYVQNVQGSTVLQLQQPLNVLQEEAVVPEVILQPLHLDHSGNHTENKLVYSKPLKSDWKANQDLL